LRLGIQSLEFSVALSLLRLLTLRGALFGLLLFLNLLDLLDSCIARCLDLAENFGAETACLDKHIGDPQELLEDGEEGFVVVVGWEAILEIDALAGNGLVDAAALSVNRDTKP
jgi:hypothetical protein